MQGKEAIQKNASPLFMGVAEYKHTLLKEWKKQLPSEKELKEQLKAISF